MIVLETAGLVNKWMFLYGNKMQDFPSNYPKHVLMVFHPCINLVVSYNVLAWNYQICFKSYALLKVSEHWNFCRLLIALKWQDLLLQECLKREGHKFYNKYNYTLLVKTCLVSYRNSCTAQKLEIHIAKIYILLVQIIIICTTMSII